MHFFCFSLQFNPEIEIQHSLFLEFSFPFIHCLKSIVIAMHFIVLSMEMISQASFASLQFVSCEYCLVFDIVASLDRTH
jgi:hypothetical protein